MNKISLSKIESSIFEPFDLEFSYTQISLYDTTFKEASLLLEKADNLRSSFLIPIKFLLSSCECESLSDCIETWVYAISANCQGRVAESGLRFETQNPYVRLLIDVSRSECGSFFENLKQFLRVAFEARANLSEINQNLHILGSRAQNFFSSIKAETQKLELNSISASIIRRNITQNIQKISSGFGKIKGLDLMFKQLEVDKPHFLQSCNEMVLKADEIGLRGWYENRLSPRQFKELISVSPQLAVRPSGSELEQETTASERVEKEKPVSDFTGECKNEELKASEANNQCEGQEIDEPEAGNNWQRNKEMRESGGEAVFPMLVPFSCLGMSNEVIGTGPRSRVLEANFMGRKCAVKCLKLEETQVIGFLTEVNNLQLLRSAGFVSILGFGIAREPLGAYLVYEAFPYDLNDLLFKRRKELRFNEKIDLCIEILKSIDVLYKMEMVHGNITTSNVLLDENLKPFLADYGLARFSKKCSSKYDSLEFINDGKYRKEQDIYSFGVIFYEVMGEREAWGGMRDEEIALEKRKLNFFNRNGRIAKEIDEIVEKCVNVEEEEMPSPRDLIMMIGKVRK